MIIIFGHTPILDLVDIYNLIVQFSLLLTKIRGQSWRSGTRCDCKTDWLWVRSPLEEMKYLLKFIFPFLRSGVEDKRVLPLNTQCIQNSAESGERSVNTRFPLCAGYSVKLISFDSISTVLNDG